MTAISSASGADHDGGPHRPRLRRGGRRRGAAADGATGATRRGDVHRRREPRATARAGERSAASEAQEVGAESCADW